MKNGQVVFIVLNFPNYCILAHSLQLQPYFRVVLESKRVDLNQPGLEAVRRMGWYMALAYVLFVLLSKLTTSQPRICGCKVRDVFYRCSFAHSIQFAYNKSTITTQLIFDNSKLFSKKTLNKPPKHIWLNYYHFILYHLLVLFWLPTRSLKND